MTTAAVLATLDEYADAYCSKDTDRLMAIFDPGDDITVIGTGNDELCTGQQQVRDLFNRNFAEATATRFEHHWTHATIRGDTAVIASTLTIHVHIDGHPAQVPLRWTVALHRRSGEWRWLHRHASSAATSQKAGGAYPR